MHGMTDRRWAMAGMAVALVAAGFLAGSGFVLVWAQGHVHKHEHGGGEEIAVPWLTRLGPEARMRAIERQFDGFAPAMADVAYRYVELYFGGIDGNWDYAAHMIEEMKITIANGLERRPQYRGHAETLLLKGALPPVIDAIQRKDTALFKARIEALRAACTACHAAEGVPFIKIGIPSARRNPVVGP